MTAATSFADIADIAADVDIVNDVDIVRYAANGVRVFEEAC